jgi:hypothetical protein
MNILIQSTRADVERAIAVAQYEGKQLFTHRTCGLKAVIQRPNQYSSVLLDYFCLMCQYTVHSCNITETYEHQQTSL